MSAQRAVELLSNLVITLAILIRFASSTFVDNPSDTQALFNGQTSLSCYVHDEPPLPSSIRWYKDGLLRSSDDRVQASYNSSTRTGTYSITSVLYADNGAYSCRAYNSSDFLLYESTNGTLTVTGKPAFDPQLSAQTTSVGSTVTMECAVVSNPAATISWSFKGSTLTASSKISFSGNNLTITGVQLTDSGTYKCTAENSHGTNSTSALLTVLTFSQPEVIIVEAPLNPEDSYEINEGQSLTLTCNVEGDGISNIQWKNIDTDTVVNEGVTMTSTKAILSFTSIANSDEGQYECSASTTSGGYSTATIQITVYVLPVVDMSLSVVTKTVNDMFSGLQESPNCTVTTGDTPLTFEWTDQDGNTVQSQEFGDRISRLSVNIQFLTNDDIATYTCTATNGGGSDSDSFLLDILYSPISQILNPTVQGIIGEDLFIPCSFDANPPAEIEWFQGFFDDPLTLPHTLHDDGITLHSITNNINSVKCTGTNSQGSAEIPYFLTVTDPPSVQETVPEEDFRQSIASDMTIECRLNGPSDSEIIWYHNGTKVTTSDRISFFFIQGFSSTIQVSNVEFDDAGRYTCNVTYKHYFGFVNIDVSVGVPPSIETYPKNRNVSQSEQPLIDCVASGIPVPGITWFHTGIELDDVEQQILDGDNYRFETKGLRLLNPQRSDSGTYKCVADNEIGSSASANASITVEGEPQVLSITPTHFIAGENATLFCSILYNYPLATFNWTQGVEEELRVVDPDRFTIFSNGELFISRVIPGDQDTITCHGINDYGTSSVSQDITVDLRPIVSFSRTSVHLVLNTNLTVTCSAFSRPEATLEVYLPSGLLAISSQFDPVTGILDIPQVTPSFRGTYTCFGTNIIGLGNDTLTVTVMGAPPSGLTATSNTATSAFVSWLRPPVELDDSLSMYHVRYWKGEPSDIHTADNVTEIFSFLAESLFEGLEEYTRYSFEVKAVYEEDIVSETIMTSVITLQDAPSAAPRNVSLESRLEEIQIDWEAPEIADQNGIVEGYNIWYRTSRPNSTIVNGTIIENILPYNETFELIVYYVTSSEREDESSNENAVLQYNLTNLEGGTSYDVVLQAFTVIGPGPGSDIVTAKAEEPFPLTLVLGVTVPVGTLILVVLIGLLIFGMYFGIRKAKQAGKFSFRSAEEGKSGKKRKKRRTRREDISDPVPEYPPDVDISKSKGKFVLEHSDGTKVSSHPKIIKSSDVEKKRKSGAKVVSKKESVMSDLYEDPDKVAPRGRKKSTGRGDPKRDGFAPRDSRGSNVYEKPKAKPKQQPQRQQQQQPKQTRPPPKKTRSLFKDEDEDDEDIPEEVPVAFDWGAGDEPEEYSEEEEEESEDDSEEESEEESDEEESPPPRYQEAMGKKRRKSSQQELYATVSDEHKAKKRSQMLKEKMKQQEKMRKEQEKMAAKKRKEQEKMKKKIAAEKKKQMKQHMKEKQRRQSMGLDNIIGMADLDPAARGSRAMRRSFDSSSADLF